MRRQRFVSALRSKVNRNVSLYAVTLPRRHRDRHRRQRHEPPRPGHGQQLPGHPHRAGWLLARRGGHRRGARGTHRGVRFRQPPAAGHRTSTSRPSRCSATAASGWARSRTSARSTTTGPSSLCHGADPICNPADPHTWQDNWPQHLAGAYIDAGMANQAADFVAGKLA